MRQHRRRGRLNEQRTALVLLRGSAPVRGVPHRGNTDSSRMWNQVALPGKLFYWRGALYRPAQDSSVAYSHAISINKIERLWADEFAEVEVSRIQPKWRRNLTRNHTVNHATGLTVMIVFRHVQAVVLTRFLRAEFSWTSRPVLRRMHEVVCCDSGVQRECIDRRVGGTCVGIASRQGDHSRRRLLDGRNRDRAIAGVDD